MIRIARSEDIDESREIHSLAFEGDPWVGDDHEYWFAYDGTTPVGWASAIYWPSISTVFLSRAAVAKCATGKGLHRRLIQARIRWAQKCGATHVITYTAPYNYESFINLLKCGFRFSDYRFRLGGRRWHVLLKSSPPLAAPAQRKLLRAAAKLM
jgi:GNAT superfamily N-acetyltransferase